MSMTIFAVVLLVYLAIAVWIAYLYGKDQTGLPVEQFSKEVSTVEDWADLATGASGYLDIEREWLRAAQRLYQLFCKKQHDYGDTNIGLGGLRGVVLRTGDKMSRLWNLVGLRADQQKQQVAVNDEAIEDTLLDLADYGIIGYLVATGKWRLYTPEEVWSGERTAKP